VFLLTYLFVAVYSDGEYRERERKGEDDNKSWQKEMRFLNEKPVDVELICMK
jgi:hypothetical protein